VYLELLESEREREREREGLLELGLLDRDLGLRKMMSE